MGVLTEEERAAAEAGSRTMVLLAVEGVKRRDKRKKGRERCRSLPFFLRCITRPAR
ncbi:hypothetical protein J2T17_002220 [Paenibacillus mucilaginosus]|uniref:hypothetical protein n=1 Tax=Paenibacillus mucilaginosus TaxID=61624 RepID=UPI003D1B4AB7